MRDVYRGANCYAPFQSMYGHRIFLKQCLGRNTISQANVLSNVVFVITCLFSFQISIMCAYLLIIILFFSFHMFCTKQQAMIFYECDGGDQQAKSKKCVGHGRFQHFQHVIWRRKNGCLRNGNRTMVLKQQSLHFVHDVTLKIPYFKTINFQNIIHKSTHLSCAHLLCVHVLTTEATHRKQTVM